MVETGVIHGRFQVFHLKHMEYLLAAKMHCKRLFIGITHPDDLHFATSENDTHGYIKRDNPMTFYERFEMIHDALIDFGVKREDFEIIPLPISQPEYILQYAPKDATYFMSISDKWGEEKHQIFKNLGLEIEVLWHKSEEEKGITATQVREAIANDKEWQTMVPKTVYEYIIKHKIDQRIKTLYYEL